MQLPKNQFFWDKGGGGGGGGWGGGMKEDF